MLKDDVLNIIYWEEDFISGEAISRKLGVSRAAVNSAVKALRDEGYEITSSTNKGYLLTKSPDILTKGSVSVPGTALRPARSLSPTSRQAAKADAAGASPPPRASAFIFPTCSSRNQGSIR